MSPSFKSAEKEILKKMAKFKGFFIKIAVPSFRHLFLKYGYLNSTIFLVDGLNINGAMESIVFNDYSVNGSPDKIGTFLNQYTKGNLSFDESGDLPNNAEKRGTGVNTCVYWVTDNIQKDWV